MTNRHNTLQICQGEPITLIISEKNDDGSFKPDLSSYHFEALLRDANMERIKAWSSDGGSIIFDQVTEETGLRGRAVFSISGEETADLEPKDYTLELALRFENGRAIDRRAITLSIYDAAIRKGI